MDSVYIEADGCRITTNLALAAFENTLLMLLGQGEAWTPNIMHTMDLKPALHATGNFYHIILYTYCFVTKLKKK